MNRLDFIWKCNEGGRLKSRSDCSINWGKWISKLLLSVWNVCMSLWYIFGSNGIVDGLSCPHWLILMMKRMGITKRNVIIVYVWCVEKGWKAFWIIIDVISCLCCCELCDVMKMVISSLFVWTCHLHYSEALVVASVMCIEK